MQAGSLPCKDVRIYGDGSSSRGQLSVVRDVYNFKKNSATENNTENASSDASDDKTGEISSKIVKQIETPVKKVKISKDCSDLNL